MPEQTDPQKQQQSAPLSMILTQPKIAFFLSFVALGGVIYTATDKLVRHQIEFDTLKTSYTSLKTGQDSLRDEVKAMRVMLDGEIRNVTEALGRVSDELEKANNRASSNAAADSARKSKSITE